MRLVFLGFLCFLVCWVFLVFLVLFFSEKRGMFFNIVVALICAACGSLLRRDQLSAGVLSKTCSRGRGAQRGQRRAVQPLTRSLAPLCTACAQCSQCKPRLTPRPPW